MRNRGGRNDKHTFRNQKRLIPSQSALTLTYFQNSLTSPKYKQRMRFIAIDRPSHPLTSQFNSDKTPSFLPLLTFSLHATFPLLAPLPLFLNPNACAHIPYGSVLPVTLHLCLYYQSSECYFIFHPSIQMSSQGFFLEMCPKAAWECCWNMNERATSNIQA